MVEHRAVFHMQLQGVASHHKDALYDSAEALRSIRDDVTRFDAGNLILQDRFKKLKGGQVRFITGNTSTFLHVPGRDAEIDLIHRSINT